MSFGSAIAEGVAMQTFRFFVILAAVIALASFVVGRATAPPSAYQQMREADRRDLIQQKNLSKRDLELLGAPVR